MYSPLRLNITTMVKSSEISVMGEMRGMNFLAYHSFPFRGIKVTRVMTPPRNGIPRYIKTLSAMSRMETLTTVPLRPNQPGRMVMNT